MLPKFFYRTFQDIFQKMMIVTRLVFSYFFFIIFETDENNLNIFLSDGENEISIKTPFLFYIRTNEKENGSSATLIHLFGRVSNRIGIGYL